MLDKSAYQLILGSASPRRKELLAYLYLPFEIITADITEESREEDPVKWVEDVAIKKSVAIFAQLNFEQYKNPFLITADTIVCLGQKVFGKPQSHEEAKKMLLELSGKEHYVYTAVCLKTQKKQLSFVVGSQVQFTAISNELLNLYVATNEPMDRPVPTAFKQVHSLLLTN